MPVQGGPGERGTRLGLGQLLGVGRVIERAGEAVGLDVTKCLERDAVADDFRLAILVRSAAWRGPEPRSGGRTSMPAAASPASRISVSGIERLSLLVDAPALLGRQQGDRRRRHRSTSGDEPCAERRGADEHDREREDPDDR